LAFVYIFQIFGIQSVTKWLVQQISDMAYACRLCDFTSQSEDVMGAIDCLRHP
jgi:hypothetical protein